tara:strand:- start:304 stop:486 length:183 start_codon:yes stop_codon:yes gene_type:complete
MKVKDFLKRFSKADMETEILFSSDEELNILYRDCRIDELAPDGWLVVFGCNPILNQVEEK